MLSRESLTLVAKEEGFSRLRIASLQNTAGIEQYDRFLEKELYGSMSWMRRSRPPRADPTVLLPEAKSLIVLGSDYFFPIQEQPQELYARVSRYAWGKDYHKRLSKRLLRFARRIKEQEPSFKCYFGVDSRPFIERAWAEISGLGFIGKNAVVISPGDSSFFFLAMMLCNQELIPDAPIQKDHCGRCKRCLVQCPTDAFIGASQLDARRCISYLTIEHRGIIPDALKEKMGNWLFGCDVCQDVCPHNHRPTPSLLNDFRPLHAWVDLEWLLEASDEEINRHFAGSPVRRAKATGLRRNAAICLGNMQQSGTGRVLHRHTKSESLALRDAAVWALERIG